MIEFFVRRPITTLMVVLVFVILGLVSYFNIPVEQDPKIDFPIVTVTVDYPGATPLEVETLVVNKIEDAIAELSEIDKIRSFSYEGRGYIFTEFDLKANVNTKFIEVKDKVEAILNDLPDAIEKPLIEKYDPMMVPVMELVLSSDGTYDERDLFEYADKVLKQRLSGIAGVANVTLYGGKKRQVNVTLDPMLLKKHYLSIDSVIEAIALKNKNIPGGLVEKGFGSSSLRFVGEFKSVDEIARMTLTSPDGKSFRLADIGKVEDGYKKIDSIAVFNGKKVVGLSLNKVSDGNAVNVARAFFKQQADIKKTLPKGMDITVANDTTKFIINETLGTEWNILIGILLTVAILYFFTGQMKLTFIAAVVIPTSIVSTFYLMDASKFSINFMTLLAIATSLGTLIANAIVIIESVLMHLEKGKTPIAAAIEGTKEVAAAVIASTGTNLVVFTPIAFMGGIVGQFMRSFGLTVVYATLFSLLASFTLTPMLCGLLLKKKDAVVKKHFEWKNPFSIFVVWTENLMRFLLKEYQIIFKAMFRHPKLTIVITIFLFWCMRFVMPYVDSDFYPASDSDTIGISIVMPQGSTIERTQHVVEKVEARIKSVAEVDSYLTFTGSNGVERSSITVNLKPQAERKRSDKTIINELIPFMSSIPDAEINMTRGSGPGVSDGDVTLNVYGKDYDRVIEISAQMKEKMEKSGYFRSVTSSYKTPKSEIRFVPDEEKLMDHGVSNARLGNVIRSSVFGNDSNVYKENGEEYKVNVELNKAYARDMKDLEQIGIVSVKGLVPVTELGRVSREKSLPTIVHRDRERIITLDGFLSKSSLGYVTQVLEKEFKNISFGEGYGYRYVGNSDYQEESERENGKAFMLAIILTLMLLSALMNSLLYPLVIVATIATSFLGVFLFLFFFEQSMNVASMLAMVMLVGIVVNNAILFLDYTIQKMNEGVEIVEAIWLGASVKFRAILMTSIAIILGTLPQMYDVVPLKGSMGTVMVGGMVASILFTFFLIPVLFWYTERLHRKFFKK